MSCCKTTDAKEPPGLATAHPFLQDLETLEYDVTTDQITLKGVLISLDDLEKRIIENAKLWTDAAFARIMARVAVIRSHLKLRGELRALLKAHEAAARKRKQAADVAKPE
jgi:hypothetical protein